MKKNTISLKLSEYNSCNKDSVLMLSLVQSWVKEQANGLIDPSFITLELLEELGLPSSKSFLKIIEIQDPDVLVAVKLTPFGSDNAKYVKIKVSIIEP